MAGLGNFFDSLAAQRERDWLRKGASREDVASARVTGIHPRDIATFRSFSAEERLLIVVRCPKPTARLWHGTFPGKSQATTAKSDEYGIVTSAGGRLMVSDYDLMSVWRTNGRKFEKIRVTAVSGAKRGSFSPRARDLVKALNGRLITKIQHGCQDDWDSKENRGVAAHDRFAAANQGNFVALLDPAQCHGYYETHGLDWPYDDSGRHIDGT